MGNTPSEILGGAEVCACKLRPDLVQCSGIKGKKVSSLEGSATVQMPVKSGNDRDSDDSSVPSIGSSRGRKGRGKSRKPSVSLEEEDSNGAENSVILWEVSCNKLEGRGSGRRLSSPNSPEDCTVVSGTSCNGALISCELSSSPDDESGHTSSSDMEIVRSFQAFSLKSNDDTSDEASQKQELPKGVFYYGWFFSPEVSSAINHIVMHLFRECFNQVRQFQKFILTCCKDGEVKDPFEYYGYKRPGKRIKPDEELAYHITAKFLGRSPDPSYQTLAHSFLDETFRIHLIGIVFTPRTLGVRVKLTTAQQLLFDEKEEKSRTSRMSKASDDLTMINQLQNELDSYDRKDKEHKKRDPKCKLKPDENGVVYKRLSTPRSTSIPVPVITSRAHITIGCAQNVLPKQTGNDLVDIVDLEQRATTRSSNFQQDFQVNGYGSVRQFGKHAEAFVFYPSFEMIVPGKFNFVA